MARTIRFNAPIDVYSTNSPLLEEGYLLAPKDEETPSRPSFLQCISNRGCTRSLKITISISRTGKLPREISIRVENIHLVKGEGGGRGVTVNHGDVRSGGPVTGYWIREFVRITLGNERLVEWRGSFHEASSNFVSIGRARSTAFRSVDFSFIKRSPFSEWRPLCLGSRVPHPVRVPRTERSRYPFPHHPFLRPFPPLLRHSSTVLERSRCSLLPRTGITDGLPASQFK